MCRHIAMEKEKKIILVAYVTFCLLLRHAKQYGQLIDKMWRYTFELRKKKKEFFAKLQTKMQKSVWKEEISAQIKQTQIE